MGVVSYHGVDLLSLDDKTKVESITGGKILKYSKGELMVTSTSAQTFSEGANIYSLAYHNFDSVGISLGSFNPAFHVGGVLYIDSFGRALYVRNTQTQSVVDSFLATL